MKENGKSFLIFGLFVLIAFVCTGCAKKYPACNDYEKFSNLDQLRIERGSTVVFTNTAASVAEAEAVNEKLAKMGLVPISGHKTRTKKWVDVWKTEVKGKDLEQRQIFEIFRDNDVLEQRADYKISYAVHDWASDDLKFYITVKEPTPDSKSLTDWQYYEYRCANRSNIYTESFPIACPIGSKASSKLCRPYAETKMLQIIQQHIE